MLGLLAIVVDVVIVADVERRIGEHQVDRPVAELREAFEAVAGIQTVERQATVGSHASGASGRVGMREEVRPQMTQISPDNQLQNTIENPKSSFLSAFICGPESSSSAILPDYSPSDAESP